MIITNNHDTVSELNDRLGPTLVAVLANSRVRLNPNVWAREQTSKLQNNYPSDDQMYRMTIALDVFRAIEKSDSADIARLWFTGVNDRIQVDGTALSPVMALRAGATQLVHQVGLAFAEDTDAWS